MDGPMNIPCVVGNDVPTLEPSNDYERIDSEEASNPSTPQVSSTQNPWQEKFDMGKVVYGKDEAMDEFMSWLDELKTNKIYDSCGTPSDLPTGVLMIRLLTAGSRSESFRDHQEYSSLRIIGCGAYGQVYLCRDHLSSHHFASKLVPLKKFDRKEVDILVKLCKNEGSGCLPLIYGIVFWRNSVSIHMELIGLTWDHFPLFDERMEEWRHLQPGSMERVLLDLLLGSVKGLQFLKRFSIIHADIKPSNMGYIKDKHQVKFLDFGSIKKPQERITLSGMTPEYMPPEVCNFEDAKCNCKVDVWALGCTFYYLLNKHHPWAWVHCSQDLGPQERANIIMKKIVTNLQMMIVQMSVSCDVRRLSQGVTEVLKRMLLPDPLERIDPDDGVRILEEIKRGCATVPVTVVAQQSSAGVPCFSALFTSTSTRSTQDIATSSVLRPPSSHTSQGFPVGRHLREQGSHVNFSIPPESPDTPLTQVKSHVSPIPMNRIGTGESSDIHAMPGRSGISGVMDVDESGVIVDRTSLKLRHERVKAWLEMPRDPRTNNKLTVSSSESSHAESDRGVGPMKTKRFSRHKATARRFPPPIPEDPPVDLPVDHEEHRFTNYTALEGALHPHNMGNQLRGKLNPSNLGNQLDSRLNPSNLGNQLMNSQHPSYWHHLASPPHQPYNSPVHQGFSNTEELRFTSRSAQLPQYPHFVADQVATMDSSTTASSSDDWTYAGLGEASNFMENLNNLQEAAHFQQQPLSQDTSGYTSDHTDVAIELVYREQHLSWKCANESRVQDVTRQVFQKARMLVYGTSRSSGLVKSGTVVISETVHGAVRKWSEKPTQAEALRRLPLKTVLMVNG